VNPAGSDTANSAPIRMNNAESRTFMQELEALRQQQ
jgi:hypothetical protein